jgi:hypothetical protein
MLIGSDGFVSSGGYHRCFGSVLEPEEEKNLGKENPRGA